MKFRINPCFFALLLIVSADSLSVPKSRSYRSITNDNLDDSTDPSTVAADHNWIFNGENGWNGVDSPILLKPDDMKSTIRTEQANRMKKYMDLLADPCDDFYQYACGNWEKSHPIPDDHYEYNMFSLLQENLQNSLKKLLAEKPSGVLDASGNPSAQDKAKFFYTSCLNSEMRSANGEKPLLEFVKKYGNWPVLDPNWSGENFDWVEQTAKLAKYMTNSLVRTSVDGDLRASDRNIIYLDEPTLTLPRRDIYLLSPNTTYMIAYKEFIKEIAQLLGASEDDAETNAGQIVEFERELAKIKSEPQDRIELEALYNLMNISQLMTDYPNADWLKYFRTVYGPNISEATPIVLLSKRYMTLLPDLLKKTDNRTVANYILWRYVKELSEDLDSRFVKAYGRFSKILTGQEDTLAEWKTCLQYTNTVMGMAVGAIFVQRHFDETSKADVVQLTTEIQQAFRDALRDNTWIDEETRIKAEEKANKIILAVGYPDDILDAEKLNKRYSGIVIHPDNYFQNSINLALDETRKSVENLYKPVDKTEWAGYPAVINAYFEQSNNRIIIPAGILQPPIYNKYFPKALNYGGIGIFVGHELTHGFDDTGRNFDKNGDMLQWWTQDSIDKFKVRGDCFADQYNKYSINGKHVNGLVTKGENIADNGGLQESYQAYSKWLAENPGVEEDEFLPGLNITGKQLFYLAFAQVWCGMMRPEAVENKLETDAHSPGRFRVLGSLTNFEDFGKDFKCAEGSAMNPKNKCKLW